MGNVDGQEVESGAEASEREGTLDDGLGFRFMQVV